MGDTEKSGHTIITDLTSFSVDQTFPPFVLCLVFIVLIPLSVLISSILEAVKPGLIGVQLNVDEDLPNYFAALQKEDKESMLKEEDNMRRNYVSLYNFDV